MALPQDVCKTVHAEQGHDDSAGNLAQLSLHSDNVFGEDSGALQLGMVSGDVASGYEVTLAAGVDTTTTPTGGQLSGDGAPAGAPPDGPPPSRG